jgi:hypothetical protein
MEAFVQLKIKELLTALHEHEVQYILFGTLGAIAYGADLATRDMDICFATDDVNRQRIAELLLVLKAKPTYTPGWNTLEMCEAWQPQPPTIENLDHQFTTPYGYLDLVPYPYGANGKADRFDYERLKRSAVTRLPFAIPIAVAHIDHLIASKMSAQRPKDKSVHVELLRIRDLLQSGEILPGLERFKDGMD